MLGLEFDFEVATLRKELIYTHHIFTGGSSNKKTHSNFTSPNRERKTF